MEPVRSGVGGGEVGEPRRKKQREGHAEEEDGRNLRHKRKQELKGCVGLTFMPSPTCPMPPFLRLKRPPGYNQELKSTFGCFVVVSAHSVAVAGARHADQCSSLLAGTSHNSHWLHCPTKITVRNAQL